MSVFNFDYNAFSKKAMITIGVEFAAFLVLATFSFYARNSVSFWVVSLLAVIILIIFFWDLFSFSDRYEIAKSSSVSIDCNSLSFLYEDGSSLSIDRYIVGKIRRNRSGKIMSVTLRTEHKQKVVISGLNDMENAYALLSEYSE